METLVRFGMRGTRWGMIGRTAFIVGVAAWLAYQLAGIGWGAVWAARPRTIWFYVIWLGLYLQLPLVEALICRALWQLPLRESLAPLLRKRTLNQDVASGLGEASFFLWTRHRLPHSPGEIAGALKDNLIASSLAAWVSLLLLVPLARPTLFATLGAPTHPRYWVVGAVGCSLVVALGVRFRQKVFTLPLRTVLGIFAVHLGRFVLLVYALQVLQWRVVVPDAPLSLWVTLLVVVTVVGRLPFVPARDLVGVSAVLGVPAVPAALAAPVASMLLVRSALDKAGNLALYGAGALRGRGAPADGKRAPAVSLARRSTISRRSGAAAGP